MGLVLRSNCGFQLLYRALRGIILFIILGRKDINTFVTSSLYRECYGENRWGRPPSHFSENPWIREGESFRTTLDTTTTFIHFLVISYNSHRLVPPQDSSAHRHIMSVFSFPQHLPWTGILGKQKGLQFFPRFWSCKMYSFSAATQTINQASKQGLSL